MSLNWRTKINKDNFLYRSSTWLELFFDLIFVGMFSFFVDYIIQFNTTSYEIVFYFVGFIAIWINWVDVLFYSHKYDNNKQIIRHRLYIFAIMLLLGSELGLMLRGISHDDLDLKYMFQILVYFSIVQSIVTLFMYNISDLRDYLNGKLIRNINLFRLMIILLFLLSGLATYFGCYIIAIIVFVLGLLTFLVQVSFVETKSEEIDIPINHHYIHERVNLLFMLIFGEIVVQIIFELNSNILILILSMITIFLIWWLNFNQGILGKLKNDQLAFSISNNLTIVYCFALMLFSIGVAMSGDSGNYENLLKYFYLSSGVFLVIMNTWVFSSKISSGTFRFLVIPRTIIGILLIAISFWPTFLNIDVWSIIALWSFLLIPIIIQNILKLNNEYEYNHH